MTINVSKLKTGTLTFEAQPFACQMTNVTITPDYKDDGDAVETLCGDTIAADTVRTDTLKITAIQDFDDPDGFIAYTWANDLTTVAFSWKPSATSPTYSGNVQIRALPVGGDVNSRLTSDAEFTIVGATVVTYPAP